MLRGQDGVEATVDQCIRVGRELIDAAGDGE
jgi:hypothetical protein